MTNIRVLAVWFLRSFTVRWHPDLCTGRSRRQPLPRVAIVALGTMLLASQVAAGTISGGWGHTVTVRPDGTVWAWGADNNGQLGDPGLSWHLTPWQVPGLSGIVAVASGEGHTLALANDGTVWAWGLNGSGQIGDGTTTLRWVPVRLSLTSIVAVAAGAYHSAALASDGTVYTWGQNANGQLGNNSTSGSSTPLAVSGVTAVAIGAGATHTLAVTSAGQVWAWGGNSSGQLGDGTTTQRLAPVQMSGVSTATAVAGSLGSSFVLLSDGTLRAVGGNSTGILGDGTQTMRTTVVAVSGLTDVLAVAAGSNHALALKTDGTVWTWGSNSVGQLGQADQTTRLVPTQVIGLGSIGAIGCGDNHSVAISAPDAPTGSYDIVWAWGNNDNGELGDGTYVNALAPLAITAAGYAARVATPTLSKAAGTYSTTLDVVVHSVTPDAELHYTTNGADPLANDPSVTDGDSIYIGQSTTLKVRGFKPGMPESNVATAVYVLAPAIPTFSPSGGTFTSPPTLTMSDSSSGVTIHYTTDGSTPTEYSIAYNDPITLYATTTVKAMASRFGWSASGVKSATFTLQYGTADPPTASPTTGTYDGQVTVTLSALSGGTVRYTTNGTDPSANSPAYTGPLTFTTTTTLKAKQFHPDYTTSATMTQTYTIRALAPSFTLSGGSYNPGTTLTISDADASTTIRITLTGVDPVTADAIVASGTQLAVGGFTLKARASKTGCLDSTVTTATYSVTEPYSAGTVSGGSAFSLVARPDGVLYGFGQNSTSQLGDGTTTTRTSPQLVQTLTGVTALAAGTSHSLARTWDGHVFAWGANSSGQLGDGTSTIRSRPIQVDGLEGVVAIAAGSNHSIALTDTGQVFTWGANSNGQLGLGSTTAQHQPMLVAGLSDVVAVAAGANHTLAVTATGQVYGWGLNGNYQLGDGTTTQRTTPVLIAGVSNVVAVAAGTYHSVALTQSGAVYVWGYGASGQLGLGNTTSHSTPTLLPGVNGLAVFAGVSFSAALRTDGQLLAWGSNSYGQLGDTTTTQRLAPVSVVGLPPTTLIASGASHMIAMTSTGEGWTWGLNTTGQQGDGSTTNHATPQHSFTLTGTWGATPAPVLSLTGGTYNDPQTLVVSEPMSGATVHYTTTGDIPTEADAEIPTDGTFAIDGTQTLRFRSWGTSLPPSPTVTAAFVLQPLAPSVTPAPGTYTASQTVTISTPTPNATLRFTLDGTEPTEASGVYSGGFGVATGLVVKAKAFRANWTPSTTTAVAFAFNYGVLDPPTAIPGSGTYAPSQSITLSGPSGSVITYTWDGTDPTVDSFVYNSPLTLPNGTSSLRARSFRTDWSPSSVASWTFVASTDSTPPTIMASVSPEPDANGWYHSDVTVTFTCQDAESGIASCSSPVTLTTEGEAVVAAGQATDMVGNHASVSVQVSIDRTPPYLTVHSPRPDEFAPAGTAMVVLRGGVLDSLSGVDHVTCNGILAAILAQTYSCDIAVVNGDNPVVVVAQDRAGLEATLATTVSVGDTPPPTSLTVSPHRLLLFEGEVREVQGEDEHARPVSGGTWDVDQPAVAAVTMQDGQAYVQALAPGSATLTLTLAGLSDQVLVEVVAAGTELPAGTTLWQLKADNTAGPLTRATVLPAIQASVQTADVPAYFFIDEGTAGGGSALNRIAGRQTAVQATTADGRVLWVYRFADGVPEQFAADASGGLLIRLSNDYAGTPAMPERIRRLNSGGHVDWEYLSKDGTLTDFAVAPDGTVYIADEAYHRPGTDLVALAGDSGAEQRFALPRDETAYPPTTAPIILPDGSAIAIAARQLSGVWQYFTVNVNSSGTFSTLDIGHAGSSDLRHSRLLPDGQGGLLVAHKTAPKIAHYNPDTGMTDQSWMVPDGLGWRAESFETEYVIGKTVGAALIKAVDGSLTKVGVLSFDPTNPAESLPQQTYSSGSAQLRFISADGTVFWSGPNDGAVFPNDTLVAPGVWAGWTADVQPSVSTGDLAVVGWWTYKASTGGQNSLWSYRTNYNAIQLHTGASADEVFNQYLTTFVGVNEGTVATVAIQGGAVTGVDQVVTFTFKNPVMAGLQPPFSVKVIRYEPSLHTIAVETMTGHPLSGFRYFRVFQPAPSRLVVETGAYDAPGTTLYELPGPLNIVGYYFFSPDQVRIWREDLQYIQSHLADAQAVYERPYTRTTALGRWYYDRSYIMTNVCGHAPAPSGFCQ